MSGEFVPLKVKEGCGKVRDETEKRTGRPTYVIHGCENEGKGGKKGAQPASIAVLPGPGGDNMVYRPNYM